MKWREINRSDEKKYREVKMWTELRRRMEKRGKKWTMYNVIIK